jgi:hypothetical protein
VAELRGAGTRLREIATVLTTEGHLVAYRDGELIEHLCAFLAKFTHGVSPIRDLAAVGWPTRPGRHDAGDAHGG